MTTYLLSCGQCGVGFKAVRAQNQPPPKYCSIACRTAAQGQPSVVYDVACEQCDRQFRERRAASRGAPRYCSRECYWASGGPAANAPNVQRARGGQSSGPKKRRATVYLGRVDGKPKYILRSHHVWNEHHPDDPVLPGEHVHHVDHDSMNDDPANLQKFSASDHAAHHADRISSSERSRRMKAYHAANPGKHRKGQSKVCPVCGVEFYRPPSAQAQTCSRACMGKLRTMKSKPT